MFTVCSLLSNVNSFHQLFSRNVLPSGIALTTMLSMTRFKLPSKIVLLTVPRRYFSLWIICLFMSCVSHAFASVNCCIVVTCCEKLNSWLSFVMFGCVFVTFQCGILRQVWYLSVSIPDLYYISYFV